MAMPAYAEEPVVYPDTDGEPMADNTTQFRYIMTIKGGLDILFRDRDDVFVAGDLLWYPVEGRPDIRIAPDVMVAFTRPKGDRSSYLQWKEGGHPPDVVFEIISPGNRPAELMNKTVFYQAYGVEEYYVFDPEAGGLWGWRRAGDLFVQMPDLNGSASPLLGIRFELDGKELSLYHPNGRKFGTVEEIAELAERERKRADQERERADRLAEQLRALGIEPAA